MEPPPRQTTPNASYNEWHHTDQADRTAGARSINSPEKCAASCIIAARIGQHRSDAEVRAPGVAMQCHDELQAALLTEGFYPYRLGIQSMDAVAPSPLLERIKAALDPKRILAPGRY